MRLATAEYAWKTDVSCAKPLMFYLNWFWAHLFARALTHGLDFLLPYSSITFSRSTHSMTINNFNGRQFDIQCVDRHTLHVHNQVNILSTHSIKRNKPYPYRYAAYEFHPHIVCRSFAVPKLCMTLAHLVYFVQYSKSSIKFLWDLPNRVDVWWFIHFCESFERYVYCNIKFTITSCIKCYYIPFGIFCVSNQIKHPPFSMKWINLC